MGENSWAAGPGRAETCELLSTAAVPRMHRVLWGYKVQVIIPGPGRGSTPPTGHQREAWLDSTLSCEFLGFELLCRRSPVPPNPEATVRGARVPSRASFFRFQPKAQTESRKAPCGLPVVPRPAGFRLHAAPPRHEAVTTLGAAWAERPEHLHPLLAGTAPLIPTSQAGSLGSYSFLRVSCFLNWPSPRDVSRWTCRAMRAAQRG